VIDLNLVTIRGVCDFVAIKKEKKEDDNENDDKGKMWESFIIARH
jgi:hypothetical protein